MVEAAIFALVAVIVSTLTRQMRVPPQWTGMITFVVTLLIMFMFVLPPHQEGHIDEQTVRGVAVLLGIICGLALSLAKVHRS